MIAAAEAARMLGVSARMVYDLFNRGALPGFRIGRAVRFDPADVETYRQSCRSTGTPATSAGASNSTVTLQVGGTELLDCFRAAGVRPKLTRSSARKAPASTPLRLVSPDQTR